MSRIFCPECGKPFDGEFTLSYHRKQVHNIDDTEEFYSDDLEKANKRIKGAVIAGIISGVITLIFTFIEASEYGLWTLFDVALIFGLTFGVYRKNRTCAVILFVYWIADKIYQLSYIETNFFWWISAGLFTGYFLQGILGTFLYQKTIQRVKHNQVSRLQTNSQFRKSAYPKDIEELGINHNSNEYGQRNQL